MRWIRNCALAACVALVFPLPAAAQINPTLGAAERGIKGDDIDTRHLRIESLKLDAHIVGRTADVTLEMLIAADGDDPYEANLALALPADAVVTGYALSVGDALIPGQLIEQPKARNIYEDEVRAGIDPGLAEISAGNRFTTRIYPIDKAHPRRFQMRFSAPFDPATGLVLPLARDGAIGSVAFDVVVDGYGQPPLVRFAGAAVKLDRDGKSWRGSVRVDQRPLRDGLTIAGGDASTMLVAEHAGGEAFFVIDDHAVAAPAAPRPGRLRVYWDRSLSHGRADPALEIEALVRLADATGPTAIDLVTFASDRPRVTVLADPAALRKALTSIVYRGGTSFAGLDGLALPDAGQCVLVSDGQTTIDLGAEFAPDCPLSVLTAASDADGARLGRIAQAGAAPLIRIAPGAAAEAAAALARGGTRIASVRDEAGRRLAFRALPAPSGNWLLVGPMPEQGGIRVRLSDASVRDYAAAGPAVRADAPGALYAAQRVQALGDDPSRHQAMVDFARRYQVAGPAMSLLVLERPDQYLRADLAPPRGFDADWKRDYRERKRDADAEASTARSKRLAFVLKEWSARKAWWNKRFVRRPRPKPSSRDEALPAPQGIVATPAPAVNAPAPEPMPGAVAGLVGEAADVVVTGSRVSEVPIATRARATESTEITLDLADLTAHRPYIAALEAAAPATRITVLGEQERAYGTVPSFYLDAAEWFRLKGDAATAELLLLSALELPLSDDETRQIVAFRLERDESLSRAVELSEQLAANNAEFRPQPQRDLALALAARGRGRGAAGRADLERAFDLLVKAALNPASSEFDGFEVIALMEANALIPDIEAAGGTWSLDQRLVGLLDTDARIVIEWTADDADIDLWVDEPNGERVFYGEKLSSAGGQISNDMTDGYGPEEYAIHRAPAGNYEVRINGFDADRLNPNGPGHVLVRLIRNFGRRTEKEVMADLDLAFQQGRNRDDEDKTKPVATLRVQK